RNCKPRVTSARYSDASGAGLRVPRGGVALARGRHAPDYRRLGALEFFVAESPLRVQVAQLLEAEARVAPGGPGGGAAGGPDRRGAAEHAQRDDREPGADLAEERARRRRRHALLPLARGLGGRRRGGRRLRLLGRGRRGGLAARGLLGR